MRASRADDLAKKAHKERLDEGAGGSPASFAKRIFSLWGYYWPIPLLVFPLYSLVMVAIGDLRLEHVALTLGVWVLAVIGERTKNFLVDISPYLVVALGYDLVRYARPIFVSAERVAGCGLRDVELGLFGFGGQSTPGDWLIQHTSPVFDVLFAVPYTVFIYVAFIYAAYLYFIDRARMRRFLWAFAIANYISFIMWMVVPAAPPWYVREMGCVIDMTTAPSAAGLLRVDELFNINYFYNFYSRAASVFGAMPSMHCAYPAIGLFNAWKYIGWRTRWLHLLYLIWMFVAAVYLDHHWIVDAMAGWVLAFVSVLLAGWLSRRFEARAEEPKARAAELA